MLLEEELQVQPEVLLEVYLEVQLEVWPEVQLQVQLGVHSWFALSLQSLCRSLGTRATCSGSPGQAVVKTPKGTLELKARGSQLS